jgi:hypothetical protein
MLKIFSKIAIALLAVSVIIMFAGCPTDVEPTGDLIPGPGAPGGGAGGNYFPTFDVNNPPSVSSWNNNGEIVNWPDPFLKANGIRITSPDEWAARREEIKKIMEFYFTGKYPAQPTDVTISGPGATGPGNLTVTVTGNNRTANFTVNNLTIPATAPNGQPPSATNKVPLVLLVGATGAQFVANGYATIDFGANSDGLDGIAQDIWQFDNNHPDRPSALVREAWKAARIIDAVEKGAGGGVIDPDKFLVTGMSRWGKDALYIGAFAESMTGKHIAVTNPVSSGSGGAAPDRGGLAQAKYKNTYFYKILDNVGGTPLVRIVPESDPDATDQGRTNHGFQTNTHARGEQSSWFGLRFQQFTDLYTDWICNYQSATNPGSNPESWHGIAGTAPVDAHFLTALCAPYALLTHDGWASAWTNAEGMYMTYLATREVYDFIGKSENIGVRIYNIGHAQPEREMYDLIDFGNLYFNRTFGTSYARLEGTATYAVTPQASFMDKDELFGEDSRMPDGKATVIDWFNPLNRDPLGRLEYLKLNWAAPNKPAGSSVAEIVQSYIDAHPDEYVLPEE